MLFTTAGLWSLQRKEHTPGQSHTFNIRFYGLTHMDRIPGLFCMDLSGRRYSGRGKWLRFFLQTELVEGELFFETRKETCRKTEKWKEACITYPAFVARGTGRERLLGMRRAHSSFSREYVPATGQMHPQGSPTITLYLDLPIPLVVGILPGHQSRLKMSLPLAAPQ